MSTGKKEKGKKGKKGDEVATSSYPTEVKSSTASRAYQIVNKSDASFRFQGASIYRNDG